MKEILEASAGGDMGTTGDVRAPDSARVRRARARAAVAASKRTNGHATAAQRVRACWGSRSRWCEQRTTTPGAYFAAPAPVVATLDHRRTLSDESY